MIGTVSSVTRLSAETIGQALIYYIYQVINIKFMPDKFEALWHNKQTIMKISFNDSNYPI